MWIYNNDYNKWFANNDSLSRSDFDFLKQELKSTRLYSRCLSGATYLSVNNLSDIYDILGDYQSRTWYISADPSIGSLYSYTSIPPQHATPIDKTSSSDFYTKYVPEYGLTLKNLFTPYKLIKDTSKNFYYVDVATTEFIDFTTITRDFTIDGIRLKDGHRVLVKNQTTNVTLLSTADPKTYFSGNYTIVQDLGGTIEYQYYNEENGIYKYTEGTLIREPDLTDYNQCIRYSVSVKLGDVNREKQFHLSRLLTGYFPMTSLSQPIEFEEKHNWILRNRVDYNNLFEINYYDIIKHGTQSYSYEGHTYSIPERTISIGEFGVILNTQESKSNIIKNKYKVNLRSITQTSKYYWICGDENTLLRVRKHDFFIDRILLEQIPTTLPNLIKTKLTSVSFFDDLNGAVVGELNTILYTRNGGEKWERIEIEDFIDYDYNRVLYSTNFSFYVAGNTGILLEFVNSISGITAYKRRISKIEDSVDEYLLVENINDLYKTTITNWPVNYSYYTQSIQSSKELLFLVTDNSNIIAYDINNSFNQIGNDFVYFDFNQNYSDIRNITQKQGSNTFYFTGTDPVSGDDGVFSFDLSNYTNLGTGSSFSNTIVGPNATYRYAKYPNEIFDYNGTQLLICGNNSLLGVSTYSTISSYWNFTTGGMTTNGICRPASPGGFPSSGTWQFNISDLDASSQDYDLTFDNSASGSIWVISQVVGGSNKVVYTQTGSGNDSGTYHEFLLTYSSGTGFTPSNTNSISIQIFAPGTFQTASASSVDFVSLDSTFEDKLKSKLLVIDYDIASKLNFFTDAGDYRLPNSITFSTSLAATGSKIEFLPIQHGITSTNNGTYSETNWITYMTDSQMTFEYYSNAPLDESTKVLISSTFSFSNINLSLTYSNTNITASASLVSYLAPMITYATHSRFNGQFLPAISAPPTSSFNIFLYDYLMVYKVPSTYVVSKGDVLLFQSPVVDTKLVVNKIVDISGFRYLYLFTEFNQNIITDLTTTTGVITLTNLNRYSDISELKYRFNSHPISRAYSLDFVDNYGDITSSTTSVLQIKPKFTYETAYYNLQYQGKIDSLQTINYNDTYYFAGGSPSSKAIVNATMSIVPNDGDTCTISLYDFIPPYTFTFKNSAVGTYQVQIGANINSTLSNLRTKILASPVNSFLSGSSLNSIQIGLTAGATFSFDPNSTWNLNFNLNNNYIGTTNYDSVYSNSFLKFGYSPTYNLMDYLTNMNNIGDVNPKFYATKEYLAMPNYQGLPLGSLTSSTVYIDYNGMTYSGGSYSLPVNKIIFGSDLQLEWQSIFINTFVDVVIHGTTQDFTNERLLVLDKYYDATNNSYVVEFHKRFNLPIGTNILLPGCTLDIISRRKLHQISSDLQELNNIQRTKGKSNSWQDNGVYSYETYQNELNFKIPTDSYAKILLSDADTIQQLSAIIYVDSKNELAMNITRLAKEYNIPIVNTINYNNKLYISCSQNHDLITGEGVILDFIGGTGSSQELNPQYSGYHVITKINETDFLTDIDYGTMPLVGLDVGYVRYTKQDPFLNYEPVDLIDLGVDRKGKISIELSIENLKLTDDVYSLIDIDYEKYRFRLIDGLNIETVNLNYSWLLEAELSGALLGISGTDLVWYKGTWIFGRWFGGVWQSGVWMSGDWYGGTWNSNIVTDKKLTAEVDTKTQDFNQSIWYTGRWYDGTWNGGVWNSGRWYGGTWNNGMWHTGTWNDGTWNNGNFEGGIWVLGTWNRGTFNCDNEPAYWLDGNWYGGDFENGMWYNGQWEQKNTLARFGTKSFNSRTANWQAGKWLSGSFYSYINTNDQGVLDVCDVHKYSIWKTGQWMSGEWYGGIAYNMDFKTGTWYGGILEEIQVIGVDIVNNTFTLNGIFKFNIGDTIYLIDNQLGNANSVYGSNLQPGSYKVLYQVEDSTNNWTILYVDSNLNGPAVTAPVETGLRVVSRFKNLNWKSGIWTNGIYDSGLWEGGIWYNGVFSGVWA